MITVCPKCSLKLTVTSADLNIAQGYVRCGRCSNVFNALQSLVEEAQQPGAAQSQARQAPPQQAPAQQAPAQQAAAPQMAAPAQRTQQAPAANNASQAAPQAAAPAQRVAPSPVPGAPPQQTPAVQTGAPAQKAPPSSVPGTPPQQTPAGQMGAPAQKAPPFSVPGTPSQQTPAGQMGAPAQKAPPFSVPGTPSQQTPAGQVGAPAQKAPPFSVPGTPSQQMPAGQMGAPAQKAPPAPVPGNPPAPQMAAPGQKAPSAPPQPRAPAPPASGQKVTPFTPSPSKTTAPPQKAAPPPPSDDAFGDDISLEFDATSTNVTGVFIPPGDKRNDAESIPGMSMDEVTVTNVRPIQQPQPNTQARRAPAPPQRPQAPPPPRSAGAAGGASAPGARADRNGASPVRQQSGAAQSRPERSAGAGVASERNRPQPPSPVRNGRNGAPSTPAPRPQRSAPPPPSRASSESAFANDDSDFDLLGPDDRESSSATMRADRGTSQSAARAERAGRGPSDRFAPITGGALGQVIARLQNVPPAVAWSAGSGLLFVVLLLQIIHHYRGDLAAQPQFFGPMTAVYRAIGVSLVPKWDLEAYEVRQLGAVAGRDNPGQLTVRASVKNGAQNSQPLPLLRVIVQDRFGNRVAARDVPPAVYAARRAAQAGYIGAGQRVDAEIRFVDPGQVAVGFEIDACLPASGGGTLCAEDGAVR